MTDLLIKELEQMGKHPIVRLNTDRQVWKESAEMLRRQHEAIKQLREALYNTKQSLIGNTSFTYSPNADEVIAAAEQALKDTEEFQ